jgi:benzoate/toluate 1,2-dioxygenase alpha subunit
MRNGNADVAVLIEPGRVHRDVYTDPEIFELEMERIFGRAWLYVGHASQVREPGDYITTELGRQPVIMVRHRDGAIHVLLNRCTHRGAKVVNERKGNASRLICCYHGWSFDTDGRLAAVPVPEGCAAAFDQSAFGLARAPRVGEYRGFVFASLAENPMSFEDHIGPMKRNIDDLVDRAPAGELALDAGMHRYVYAGNWKLQVENVLDSYHVPFGHASTVNKQGALRAARATARARPSSRPRRSRPPPPGRSARATSPATVTAGPATPRSTRASARAPHSTSTGACSRTRSAPSARNRFSRHGCTIR